MTADRGTTSADAVVTDELPLVEAVRRIYRALEMSAAIMRDPERTGRWSGAERTASAFERQAIAAKAVHVRLAATPQPTASQVGNAALQDAAQTIIDRMSGTYTARNGREVGIEGDDGEKCWIVHSDDIETLRSALAAAPIAPDTADGWRADMENAPRDGYILAIYKSLNGYAAHLDGRIFAVRHEGKTVTDYDLGWALFPGYGGVPDKCFYAWRPLPAPPITATPTGDGA